MFHLNASKYWLGTEGSFDVYLEAMRRASDIEARSGMDTGMGDLPSLLEVDNNVGVVKISGSLVAGSAGFMRYFGVTGYDDIRGALAEALNDKNVKSVMLHVSSGGGQADGVDELGDEIKQLSTMKPVSTFADGIMGSAAYWLGSYGSHISTTRLSLVGSIGVFVVHMDRSKQLADMGMKPTIIKAGKYKALGSPLEPLSADAEAKIQEQVNVVYDVFTEVVAANRGVSQAVADKKLGQGQEFMGQASVDVGLADAIMSYGQALAHSKSLDKSKPLSQTARNLKGASAMKVKATVEQFTAIANGASRESLGFAADAELVLELPATDSTADAAALAATAAASAAAAKPEANMVAFLENQLGQATTKLVQSEAAKLTLDARFTSLQTAQDPLVAIARASVNSMSVSLGGSGTVADKLDPLQLAAEHSRISEEFNKKFPGGRVSASSSEGSETGAAAAPPQGFLSLVRSAQHPASRTK